MRSHLSVSSVLNASPKGTYFSDISRSVTRQTLAACLMWKEASEMILMIVQDCFLGSQDLDSNPHLKQLPLPAANPTTSLKMVHTRNVYFRVCRPMRASGRLGAWDLMLLLYTPIFRRRTVLCMDPAAWCWRSSPFCSRRPIKTDFCEFQWIERGLSTASGLHRESKIPSSSWWQRYQGSDPNPLRFTCDICGQKLKFCGGETGSSSFSCSTFSWLISNIERHSPRPSALHVHS